MRKFLILFTILLFAVNIFGQAKYKTYSNSRFGYSILYPSKLLKIQPPPFNNDGRRFVSSDENTEMTVWAHFNAAIHTLNEEYKEDLKNYGDTVTYKVLMKNGYVISGIKGDRIYYQKTLYHKFKNVDVFYIFTIKYKVSERKKFDKTVQKVAESFKFDPKADV